MRDTRPDRVLMNALEYATLAVSVLTLDSPPTQVAAPPDLLELVRQNVRDSNKSDHDLNT